MERDDLSAFLEAHRPGMVLWAEQIVRDKDAAEDVVQKTCEYLIKNASRYDPSRSALLSWVLMIVQSRAYNWLSKSRKYVPYSDHRDEAGLEPSLEDTYISNEQVDLMMRMVGAIRGAYPEDTVQFLEVVEGGYGWRSALARILDMNTGSGIDRHLAKVFKRWRVLLRQEFTPAEIAAALEIGQ